MWHLASSISKSNLESISGMTKMTYVISTTGENNEENQ